MRGYDNGSPSGRQPDSAGSTPALRTNEVMNMTRTIKYDITVDGYRIRTTADYDRADLSKAERKRKHRKLKLEKRQYQKLFI